MKKVMIIGSRQSGLKNDPSVIAANISSNGVSSEVVYWEDLLFDISTGSVKITVGDKDILADKIDLVIAIGWYKNGKKSIYRDIAFSLALVLKRKGIPFWNSEMSNQRSITKLSCMVQLALENVSIPKTYFSLGVDKAIEKLDMPFIAKAAGASRGASNFLIKSDQDLDQVRESDAYFVIQPYLENDHDLRVICFNGKPTLILRRARKQGAMTHLNNASQGADATWIEMSDINPSVLTISEKVCKITNREMAGIDFIPDVSSPNGYSCLEVNAVPQLTSGIDSNIKLAAFAKAVQGIQGE